MSWNISTASSRDHTSRSTVSSRLLISAMRASISSRSAGVKGSLRAKS